ncbi:MAG: hypothetical protein GTO60_07540 [Gammaproteobacteria bacterium]|nr:hypothetical protein [Gammaproteobacteria bacterium]
MAKTFQQLCRGRGLAIILVTHDLRIAERCADRVALMQDGTVIEEGAADQVLHSPTTEEARRFLVMESIENDGETV